MDLPITIVVEPPSLVALRALLRSRWMWVVAAAILAVAVGALVLVVTVTRAEARAPSTSLDLHIGSRPSGAELSIDGHAAGRTPATLAVAPGIHSVGLKAADAVEADYAVQVQAPGAALDAVLWRRQSQLARLRPPLPGATLAGARLQPDGGVALAVDLGGDDELQAWRLDPISDTQEPLTGSAAAARLAVSPAGNQVATIGREVGPVVSAVPERQRIVWLSETSRPGRAGVAVWQAPTADRLVDVVWTPDQRGLVAATEAANSRDRGVRTRVWLIDLASGGARLLSNLPSQIVPGAFAWRPDGGALALLAHSGSLNALCLLDLDGDFRYLADLEPTSAPPLPYPPIAWSSDSQRLAFAAPRQESSAPLDSWLQTQQKRALFVVDAGTNTPRVLAEADAQAVAWRDDGQLMTLSRSRDGELQVGITDSTGYSKRLLDLPARRAEAYAAEWDLTRARLLLATATGGGVEYWLARLALEEHP